jgi:hypothetical protein
VPRDAVAQHPGQRRPRPGTRVAPGPGQRLDERHTGRVGTHGDLTLARFGVRHLDHLEHLGAAVAVDPHLHHAKGLHGAELPALQASVGKATFCRRSSRDYRFRG